MEQQDSIVLINASNNDVVSGVKIWKDSQCYVIMLIGSDIMLYLN